MLTILPLHHLFYTSNMEIACALYKDLIIHLKQLKQSNPQVACRGSLGVFGGGSIHFEGAAQHAQPENLLMNNLKMKRTGFQLDFNRISNKY